MAASQSPYALKTLAYGLLFLGLFLLGCSAYDEIRGVAHVGSRRREFRHVVVTRAKAPHVFHEVMFTEWAFSVPFVLCGLVLLSLVRSAERDDPLSPNFPGNGEPDEGPCALDEKLEKTRRLLH